MVKGSDYFGYGSKAEYVRFFASRGTPISEIAAILGKSIIQLMAECPTLDFYRYDIFPHVPANRCQWANEEIKTLINHYGRHGADWDGWRLLLPGKSASAIKTCASRLGLLSFGGDW